VSDPIDLSLDNCGCCDSQAAPQLPNRPGLPALAYRVGTYATFFRRMLAQLGSYALPDGDLGGARPLTSLTTREPDDPAIALLDASAVVADVLTFYQERIANEGFLRTALERRSIHDLARAIGYELNPGVAASAYLAFTVEDLAGAPGVADILTGTKVQSVPPKGQFPQTFETSADITAHAAWNSLRPRLTCQQRATTTTQQIYFQGTATNLKIGDRLLIDADGLQALLRVTSVTIQDIVVSEPAFQSTKQRTLVTLDGSTTPECPATNFPQGKLDITTRIALDENAIDSYIRGCQWADRELNAFLIFNQWDPTELLTYLSGDRKNNPSTHGNVYAMRTMIGFFGNNAPRYATLPKDNDGATVYPGSDWDDSWDIWTDQQTGQYYSQNLDANADVFLERPVQGILSRSWVCFETSRTDQAIFQVATVLDQSVAAFGISSKATGLKLWNPNSTTPLDDTLTGKPINFQMRGTAAYVQSELLPLVEIPLSEDLVNESGSLELDSLVLGLTIGQVVILTGERLDITGVIASEALTISDINHVGGFTTLTFETGLAYPYKRTTVTINANVVVATHGETTQEILGAGNGALANQQFTLKRPPLTYTAAPTPTGAVSTLELRVNNLLWNEAPSLYELGPRDQGYTLRIGNDSKATLIFGDGVKGARLPTGVNNLVATYRSGIGLAGEVPAKSLTILQSKPLGLRGVTNPLAATGAADPEKMKNARTNAPLTVRTLDRIVSRADYEDFASAFAGIGKAQAIDLWNGEQRLVHLTLAGADGKPITDPLFLQNFNGALNGARDPAALVKVDTFDPLLFDVVARVAIDSQSVTKLVLAAIQAALLNAFSFDSRSFGQALSAAEVITVIQNVAGVVYVDLESLYLSSDSPALNQILSANIAHATNGVIQHAQLLLINPLGITPQEIQA
jgi:uncharacterized phage protein gp47/JayE